MEEQVRDQKIETIAELLDQAIQAADEASRRVKLLREELSERLKQGNQKRYNFSNPESGLIYKTTLVVTAPIKVDFDRMISDGVLTKKQIKKITKKEFHKGLLEEAVDAGEIPADIVATYLSRSKETFSARVRTEPIPSDGQD